MTLKNRTDFFLIACLFCLGICDLHAEILLLKDGDVLTGKITREDQNLVIINNPYGELNIRTDEIKFIIRNEKLLSLEQIEIAGEKKVSAKLIDETETTKVYITENNQIVRLAKPKGRTEAEPSPTPQNRLELCLGIGFSNLPFIDLKQYDGEKETLAVNNGLQSNFHFAAAYRRQIAEKWRLGLETAGQYKRIATSEGDATFSITETYRYLSTSSGITGQYVLWRTENQEVGAGIAAGANYVQVNIDLSYPDTDPASAPARQQNLKGSTISPYTALSFAYAYRLTRQLHLIGALSFRYNFYRNIYQTINGQNISENILNDSLKNPLLNNFTARYDLIVDIGVAYVW